MRLTFGILLSLMVLFPLGAHAQKRKCPAGCFCLNDGEYEPLLAENVGDHICKDYHATLLTLDPNGGTYFCTDTAILGTNILSHSTSTHYYISDFSEFYNDFFGGYGFKDKEFIYINQCYSSTKKYDYIFQCPYHFPHSAKGSKSLGDCFKYDINGNKIYYGSESKIECAEGTYLPAGTTTCKSCNASKNQICPGGRFAKSEIKNQGLKVNCNPGEFLPANTTECSTCDTENYQCLGGTYDASLMQDQGRTPIQNNGYIPGGDRPFIVCQPGFYVPANTTTCTACTGDNICLGGIFYADTHYNTDRGATPCNYGKANATHTECIHQTTKPSVALKNINQTASKNIATTSYPISPTVFDKTTNHTETIEKGDTVSPPATNKSNKNTQLSISSATAFSWDKLDGASLFTPSIEAKSATPIRTRVATLNASDTRSRTVINNTKRTVRQDKTNKSRQAVTPKKTSRPTSGKNTSKNMSSTTSQPPK